MTPRASSPHAAARGQRGQVAVEWLGIMVVVVVVVATALVSVGPAADALIGGVAHELCAVTGGHCPSGPGDDPAAGIRADPNAPIGAGEPLPPGVTHLSPKDLGKPSEDERYEHPWTYFGISEDDWHKLEEKIRDQVCDDGWTSYLTGCGFERLILDEDGHVVPQIVSEDGLGGALGKILKSLSGAKAAPALATALRTAAKDLPLAVKTRLIALGALKSPLEELPKYVKGAKTQGVLDAGSNEAKLISGYKGPSSTLPKGTRGFDNVFKSHVEGHAAAVMRQTGLKRATLYINQNPCRVCVARLPRALPAGYELRVVGPGGDVWIFKGLP